MLAPEGLGMRAFFKNDAEPIRESKGPEKRHMAKRLWWATRAKVSEGQMLEGAIG